MKIIVIQSTRDPWLSKNRLTRQNSDWEQEREDIQPDRYDSRKLLDPIDINHMEFVDKSGVNLGMTRLYKSGKIGGQGC